jgi:hypothetical protein
VTHGGRSIDQPVVQSLMIPELFGDSADKREAVTVDWLFGLGRILRPYCGGGPCRSQVERESRQLTRIIREGPRADKNVRRRTGFGRLERYSVKFDSLDDDVDGVLL